VRGEVTVELRTDDPDARFAPGSSLRTDPPERGPLVVAAARPRPGGLVVTFEGLASREDAEALRGTVLVVDSAELPPLAEDDEWYDHDLLGLSVVDPAGAPLGTVADVLHSPASDLLVVKDAEEREHLVPFLAQFVPTVDIAGGRVVVDAPEGLFDL
jgi:16S rRNA processing protein RimM